VRVSGGDKPGRGADIAQTLAENGVNLRGLSGAVIGRKFVVHLALDTAADATEAVRVLKKL
jgi:predicted amino acid-binding ACT domain protein